MTELIDVTVDAVDGARLRQEAAAVGLPVELALYIAIEADRAVDETAAVTGVDRVELIAALDATASEPFARGLRHLHARPLEAYAAALDAGVTAGTDLGGPLRVRVPHRVAAAWAHQAAGSGVPFERWLADAARRGDTGHPRWEAAAARSGRTLAEWVLLQATRCARWRSTSPHTTASG